MCSEIVVFDPSRSGIVELQEMPTKVGIMPVDCIHLKQVLELQLDGKPFKVFCGGKKGSGESVTARMARIYNPNDAQYTRSMMRDAKAIVDLMLKRRKCVPVCPWK